MRPCRRHHDVSQDRRLPAGRAARRRRGPHPRPVDDASPRRSTGIDGLLLTGGEDVAPSRYGETAAPVGRRRRRRSATRFEIGAHRGSAPARPPNLRHLPRHPGAERRLRRHARPGHPDRGARRARPQPDGAAARVVLRSPTKSGSRRTRCSASLMRERLSDADSLRRQQPASPGGQGGGAGLSGVRHGAGRRHRSDRGSGRPLLPRRPVAPRELLAHGRVPTALRRLPRGGAVRDQQALRETASFTRRVHTIEGSNLQPRTHREGGAAGSRPSRACHAPAHDHCGGRRAREDQWIARIRQPAGSRLRTMDSAPTKSTARP